jgi:hypothetical protein
VDKGKKLRFIRVRHEYDGLVVGWQKCHGRDGKREVDLGLDSAFSVPEQDAGTVA